MYPTCTEHVFIVSEWAYRFNNSGNASKLEGKNAMKVVCQKCGQEKDYYSFKHA